MPGRLAGTCTQLMLRVSRVCPRVGSPQRSSLSRGGRWPGSHLDVGDKPRRSVASGSQVARLRAGDTPAAGCRGHEERQRAGGAGTRPATAGTAAPCRACASGRRRSPHAGGGGPQRRVREHRP